MLSEVLRVKQRQHIVPYTRNDTTETGTYYYNPHRPIFVDGEFAKPEFSMVGSAVIPIRGLGVR